MNRTQTILLVILISSVLDFIVGSFVNSNPSVGIVGYSHENLINNLFSNYSDNVNAFTVYSVFFPTMSGMN